MTRIPASHDAAVQCPRSLWTIRIFMLVLYGLSVLPIPIPDAPIITACVSTQFQQVEVITDGSVYDTSDSSDNCDASKIPAAFVLPPPIDFLTVSHVPQALHSTIPPEPSPVPTLALRIVDTEATRSSL